MNYVHKSGKVSKNKDNLGIYTLFWNLIIFHVNYECSYHLYYFSIIINIYLNNMDEL